MPERADGPRAADAEPGESSTVDTRVALATEVGVWAEVRMRGAVSNHLPAAGLKEETFRYGEDPEQRVRLMWSREGSTRPLVVFIHGGSWQSGDPETYAYVGRFLAREGFATAIVGYRHVPEYVFPAQIDDVLDAVAAARERCREKGLAADRVALTGHSAGAHLAALAALDTERAAARGLEVVDIDRLVLLSGPLDFGYLCAREACPLIEELMGGPAPWDRADPACFIDGGVEFPVLLVHGEDDVVVDPGASCAFTEAVNRVSPGTARLVLVPGMHHMDTMEPFLGTESDLARQVLTFLRD